MPGPPPAGVSSTVRCLSVAKLLMSRRSSCHSSSASALPVSPIPRTPGKASGNSVRIRAVKSSVTLDRLGIDDQPARGEVDRRHGCTRERQHQPGGAGDLDHIARAEIMDGTNAADSGAARIADLQPDQIGMVDLLVAKRWQPVARRVKPCPFQRFRLLTGLDTGEARREPPLDLARDAEIEAPPALGQKRRIITDRGRIRAEGFQPRLATDAKSAGDGADADHAFEVGAQGHLPVPLWGEISAFLLWPPPGEAPPTGRCQPAARESSSRRLPPDPLPRIPSASPTAVMAGGAATMAGAGHPRIRRAPAPDYSAAASSSAGAASSSAGAAAASSAAFWRSARSSARFWAFSPGFALFGFIRSLAGRRPAASSMRAIRSLGFAPCSSQYWMRSIFIFTRSSLSRGRSGL